MLGPPVCHYCKVLAYYTPNEDRRIQGKWQCPINIDHETGHLWEMSISEQKAYIANTKFIKFVINDKKIL